MIQADNTSKILVSSLNNYLKSANASKLVIGLSGGIDSAVAAAIAVDAVGSENVYVYFMPYVTSNPISKTIAEEVAKNLNLSLTTIDITKIVDAFFLNDSNMSPLRKGNIMARVRMTNLFDMAQKHGALVAGTSNKTECLLGYGTWYGDTASSINLLGTLYKRDVYELARFYKLPQSVIDREPSADLWEGQTDEQELGITYADADSLLYAIFDKQLSPETVNDQFDKTLIDSVAKRVINNEFKRHTAYVCGEELSYTNSYADIIKKYI